MHQEISKSPFFIIANPRSGSTLFRLVLNSNIRAVVPPECGFMQYLFKTHNNLTDRDKFALDIYNSRKFNTWNITLDEVKSIVLNIENNTYQKCCFRLYEKYAANNGKSNINFWGDKNNYYISHLNELIEIFPDAKFIWLKRDLRDSASSLFNVKKSNYKSRFAPIVPHTIKDIFLDLLNNEKIVMDFFAEVKPENKLTVLYEKFVNMDDRTFQEISRFTNIDILNSIVLFNQKSFMDEPVETMEWKQGLKVNLNNQSVGKYKESSLRYELDELNMKYNSK